MNDAEKNHVALFFNNDQHRRLKEAAKYIGTSITNIAKPATLKALAEIEEQRRADGERKKAIRKRSVAAPASQVDGYRQNALLRKGADSSTPAAPATRKEEATGIAATFASMKAFLSASTDEHALDERLDTCSQMLAETCDSAVEADHYIQQLERVAEKIREKLGR